MESEDGSYASDACADDLETIQEEEDAGGTLFASAAAVPTGPTALPTASVTGAPVAPAIPDGSTAIPAATTAGAADDEDDSTLTLRRGLNAVIAKTTMVKDQKVHGRCDRKCPLFGSDHWW